MKMKSVLVLIHIVVCLAWSSSVQAETMPERQISLGSDDAEEDVAPSTVVDNSPLWVCCDCPASDYICHITGTGLRFTDVQIPQGAVIDSAWLTVLPFITANDDVACTVYCEDEDNCTTFLQGNFHDVSNRARTSAKVIWYGRSLGSDWINSCNLADIVQEVVDRPGWFSGSTLAFILIPGDSAGEWRSNLQVQAWELMDHNYGAKLNCIYSGSDAVPDTAGPFAAHTDCVFLQNHPNPFNQTTVIEFILGRPDLVNLDVFDLRGRKVRTLVSERLHSGLTSVHWKGDDASGKSVASGIYFCRMRVGGFQKTEKLVVLK
jgi:hypothetical protein